MCLLGIEEYCSLVVLLTPCEKGTQQASLQFVPCLFLTFPKTLAEKNSGPVSRSLCTKVKVVQ